MSAHTVDLSTYACDLQLISSLVPFGRIWMTRSPSGFSMDSQLLYIMAFSLQYLHYPLTKSDFPDDLFIHVIHYWIRVVLAIVLAMTFLVSANVTNYYEAEDDRSWLYGGTTFSLILAAEFKNYDRSHFTTIICTFGLYLDVISWILQFKSIIKRMQFDGWLLIYIGGLYFYDIISILNLNHDYHEIYVNTDIRFKLLLIKFILLCGFLVKYFRRGLTIRVESMNEINCESRVANEIIVVSSAEEYSDKMLFRNLGMEDVSVHKKLMLPY